MDDEPGDAAVERICRWAANVGLLGRAVAIAGKAGAGAEEMYDVAERAGYSRGDFDALLVDPLDSGP